MIEAILSWQGEGDGQTAGEIWTVLDAGTEREARDAVPRTERLTRYEHSPGLMCARKFARPLGKSIYEVRVDFEAGTPEGGGEPSGTMTPPTWRWSVAKHSEPIDRDAKGNPIVNSAFEPPDNPPQRQFTELVLVVRRTMPDYDPEWALRFMDHINAADFRIAGKTIRKKCMLCDTIIPAGEQRAGQPLVWVEFTFRVRGRGWAVRFVDNGHRTRVMLAGELVESPVIDPKTRETVTKPVLLNGRGGRLYAKDGGLSFIGAGIPPGATVAREEKAVFLEYEGLEEANFSAMGLGI